MPKALVSVYDKTGLEELAVGLNSAGWDIISTGSTAKTISTAGVPVTPVEDVTGFPECFEGRVKTLHPKIHGGILAKRAEHADQMAELGIEPIDLVIVNLYPFEETVASGASRAECIEQIDIGGPAMVRAAAKNHASVAVVVNPNQYPEILEAVAGSGFTDELRSELAAKAFAHTAAYDMVVAGWMSEPLRYGENPHQGAGVYSTGSAGLANATQFGGKEMSFNNYQDTDAAIRAAWDHEDPCVAVIKHANPCGVAIGSDIAEAHRKAHACDPVSAYGGVIATNREVSLELAQQVKPIFTEVIAAPSFDPEALALLQTKKNLRILQVENQQAAFDYKPISGGMLVQERDTLQAAGDDPANWTLAVGEPADEATLADLEFAWRTVRAVKSNAILLAHDGATVGVGMGQVNRVDSCHLAVDRAGDRAPGSVAASDAFFPFADGFEVLAQAGIRAVVQPGGSIRDSEVIQAAQAAGITMYLTGSRHFFH
ncbi:bifunctional phosphoribosylaminoimidazolecarboxamide formyltransferase/IMP cyclohydrolase [Ancrocorticia populi]|uniref:Bifunctional purine biosynthesis protein PurH n=1 Tax=Ancrocorticia populi TaxID=2175228 RepID=A0A2V1KE13_9ACTO|nr:bifunctional phosphoribosylaminoimidazolecarboxamide formyltransferase/IMP cyclohydrolase [Ancrocorticia populi]PWF27569.1 bifunctional phosphoribosylaminoimidazolecarboxamide formyltransferase/inosine monophosphate cyclohydrolase [Ancrocorticia populi]